MSDAYWLTNKAKLPRISVIVPVYNEREYIVSCLKSVLAQDYPSNKIEIHVVDGASEDGSANLVQERFLDKGAPVFLHRNANRKTPRSLNLGVKASTGDVVVILGAHTEIPPNFLRLNIENLRQSNVYCSGGTQLNVGKTAKQSSISAAMGHWFGMASAPYRYRKNPGFVRTVAYGAYRKETFHQIGYFEEEGPISEDAELNWRIYKAGHKIYYDPRIKTRYYPRKKLLELARQMLNYGIYRSQVLRKHKGGLSWLHFLPPLGLMMLLSIGVVSVLIPSLGIIFAGLLLLYFATASVSAIHAYLKNRRSHPVIIFCAFLTMHLFWSVGFLVGLLKSKIDFREF